jgi:hypothetical protein
MSHSTKEPFNILIKLFTSMMLRDWDDTVIGLVIIRKNQLAFFFQRIGYFIVKCLG